MADIFNADPADNNAVNELAFNDLVGEGRKYQDPDALAKAYANIEAHARRLEAENATVRAKLDTIEANPNPNGSTPNGGGEPNHSDPNGEAPNNQAPRQMNVDEFRSQIREELKNLTEGERAKANMDAAARKLVELYGSEQEATKRIATKAQELGVGVDWLRDAASRSPEAFYATMGIAGNGGARQTPGYNPEVNLPNEGGTQNFEYFDKLRRDNPKLYFSPETQKAMMNNARKMGADFYKR